VCVCDCAKLFADFWSFFAISSAFLLFLVHFPLALWAVCPDFPGTFLGYPRVFLADFGLFLEILEMLHILEGISSKKPPSAETSVLLGRSTYLK